LQSSAGDGVVGAAEDVKVAAALEIKEHDTSEPKEVQAQEGGGIDNVLKPRRNNNNKSRQRINRRKIHTKNNKPATSEVGEGEEKV
jgi:hypothetical protein